MSAKSDECNNDNHTVSINFNRNTEPREDMVEIIQGDKILTSPPEIERKISVRPFIADIPELPQGRPAKPVRGRRKMAGHGIIGDKSFFLKDEVQNKVAFAKSEKMEEEYSLF